MKSVAIIPVRLESSRLPNKPLKEICGIEMVLHTFFRTRMAKEIDDVFVATDSKEIKNLIEKNNGKVILTSNEHKTGTDRIAEAARAIDADIIVNVQGDEALVVPDHIDAGIRGLKNSDAQVSLLLIDYEKRNSASDIKAVVNLKNEIMYLSRNDLPSEARSKCKNLLKAYHVVSFRRDFLFTYAKLEQTPLEKIEFNEYLRILENGFKIQGIKVDGGSISVDTIEDLEYVRSVMEKDRIFKLYQFQINNN